MRKWMAKTQILGSTTVISLACLLQFISAKDCLEMCSKFKSKAVMEMKVTS